MARKYNYLLVSYRSNGKIKKQRFKLSEAYLINKVLKELSYDKTCNVILMECDKDTYDIYF